MTKYIGITIGPINETISKAKKTGEIWGASYLFSYIMKEIIAGLVDAREEPEKLEVVDTYIENFDSGEESVSIFTVKKVGLVHDRLIFKSHEGDIKLLQTIIIKTIKTLSDDFINLKKIKRNDQSKVEDYFKKYIQINYLEKEIEEGKNPIWELSPYLNTIELCSSYVEKEEKNYVSMYLENETVKDSILATYISGDSEKSRKRIFEDFPSTDNIARNKYLLNSNRKIKYKYQEFVAIVQSDADNMGSLLSKMNEINKLQDFSKKNLQQAYESHNLIKKYGGFTFYAGGDDLLFIAPLFNIKGETIFDLIDKISENFNKIFKEYIVEENKKLSLSLGVAIMHRKHPLYEGLELGRELLFDKAKSYEYQMESEKIKKNAISWKVMKHSGQEFGMTINKECMSFKNFKELMKIELDSLENNNNNEMLRSILFKITRDRIVLESLLNNPNNDASLKNYFENTFNEEIHSDYKLQIKQIEELIKSCFDELNFEKSNVSGQDQAKKAIDTVLTYLKFNAFIQEKCGIQNDIWEG
jgi:CRISPR-associated protein Cmr2